MEAEESPALQVPVEAPPAPPLPVPKLKSLDSFNADLGPNRPSEAAQGFIAVFEEMTRLHMRLLDAHEVEMRSTSFTSPRTLGTAASAASAASLDGAKPAKREPKTVSLHEPLDDIIPFPPQTDGSRISMESSGQPQPRRMSDKLMKEARQKTVDMEQMLENKSIESCSLQLREEWDLPQEKILELKKLQRRMSCGSLASLAKPTIRRQYLVQIRSPCPWYVLHPNSYRRTFWDCLALLAVLFEVCITPLHLYRIDPVMRETADLVGWIVTGFWFFDIPVSFFTAVYINDMLRFGLKDIARNYLKTWFFFDFMMLVPDIIVLLVPNLDDGTTGLLRISRARRMFRLLRFLQMFRFSKILDQMQLFEKTFLFGVMQNDLATIVRPLLTVILASLLAVHVLGSLWFAVGDTEGGWVIEERLHEAVLSRQYTRSLEWALSKLPPSSLRIVVELNTPAERWLGIIATCCVLLSSSLFVSLVTNTMADVNRKRTRTKEILQAVRTYCGTHGVSFSYTMQIKRYVQREYARNELQQHMPLLQNLPEGMVKELFQEGRSDTLHGHAFFRELGQSDPSMELNLCSQAVTELHLLAGDTIFNTTSKVQGMYMFATGLGIYFYFPPYGSTTPRPSRERSIKPKTNRKSASAASLLDFIVGPTMTNVQRIDMGMAQAMLDAGEYLAEPALWVRGWRYQGQLQALVESRVLLISTEQFFQVCQDYANVMANTVVYARCFVKELNKNSNLSKEVSDLPLAPLVNSQSIRPGTSSRKVHPGTQ